jgi:hypothetical protein
MILREKTVEVVVKMEVEGHILLETDVRKMKTDEPWVSVGHSRNYETVYPKEPGSYIFTFSLDHKEGFIELRAGFLLGAYSRTITDSNGLYTRGPCMNFIMDLFELDSPPEGYWLRIERKS